MPTAVKDAVGGLLKTPGINCGLDSPVTRIVLIAGILVVNLNPFEVLFHDEVDDTGHRVRAVGRRRASGQDLDPFDQRTRHLVNVRGEREYVTKPHTVPVGQNQRAI